MSHPTAGANDAISPMTKLRLFLLLLLSSCTVFFLGVGFTIADMRKPAARIWFAPPDDLPRGREQPFLMNEDFHELFDVPDKWATGSQKINVFSFNTTYAEFEPEERLRRIFTFLNARDIGINVSLQALFVEGCGVGIEGLVQIDHYPGDIARRLKRMDAPVQSFSFDSPLAFGHIYKGKNACAYSVEEVAKRLARTVADLRSSYPDAKFIDYESPTDLPFEQWTSTFRRWLDAYREETGTELDGMAMDANWHKEWRQAAAATVELLHAHHAQAGIFLDANGGPSVTDQSWMIDAKRNIRDVVT